MLIALCIQIILHLDRKAVLTAALWMLLVGQGMGWGGTQWAFSLNATVVMVNKEKAGNGKTTSQLL